MNGPTTPIVEVARKLTAAQRRWLFKGPPDNRSGYWPVRNAMARKYLIGSAGELSPLGIAVRNHLLALQVPDPISNERGDEM